MNINTTKTAFDDAWAPSPVKSKFKPFTGEGAGPIHKKLNGKTFMYGVMSKDHRYDITTVLNVTPDEFSIDVTITCGDANESQSYWVQEELTTGKILGMHPKVKPTADSLVSELNNMTDGYELFVMKYGKMAPAHCNSKSAMVALKHQIRFPLVINQKRHTETIEKMIKELELDALKQEQKDDDTDEIEQEHVSTQDLNSEAI